MKLLILTLLVSTALVHAQDESIADQLSRLQERALQSMQQQFSSSGTSMSLQESGDRYTIKLTLLNRSADDIEVEYKAPRLILSAPATEGSPAYEQVIPVPNAVADARPDIQRQGSTIVVTLARDPSAPATSPALAGWTDDALARVQQMQQQMNSMFENFFGNDSDPFGSLFTRSSATFQLEEQPDAYVVTARVPVGLAENMDITIEDRKLLLEAKQKESRTGPTLGLRTGTSWRDSFILPGPVDATGVTVQRHKGNLIIRLPKS